MLFSLSYYSLSLHSFDNLLSAYCVAAENDLKCMSFEGLSEQYHSTGTGFSAITMLRPITHLRTIIRNLYPCDAARYNVILCPAQPWDVEDVLWHSVIQKLEPSTPTRTHHVHWQCVLVLKKYIILFLFLHFTIIYYKCINNF